MTLLDALILAVVQGVTEFLPISSSGHLVLGQAFLGIEDPNLLFDIVLHVGTLLAVMFFYRESIVAIVADSATGLRAFARTRSSDDLFAGEGARIALFVLIATIPTGIIGLGLERVIDPDSGARLITAPVVCGLLLLNGCILITHRWIRERAPRASNALLLWNFTLVGAVVVGVAQGFAVLPGISRSGSTITAALLMGSTRTEAARFSFLLSIPAILGALVLKFDPAVFAGHGVATAAIFGLGAVVAAVVGYFCLRLLVLLLERAQFHHFAWYCWAVGIVGLVGYWAL